MSDEIGKPSDYTEGSYRDPSFPGRPMGGFLEERIAKLERQQEAIRYDLMRSNWNVPTSNTIENLSVDCKGCGNEIFDNGHIFLFPICSNCLDHLGRIAKAKEKWNLGD